MKTYEEMARDVLKRRDEELQLTSRDPLSLNAPPEVVYPASPKKRRLLPKIAIPCAAAVTAAAVGICVWNKIPQRGLIAWSEDKPLTDQDKLDFIFEEFESHKYKDPISAAPGTSNGIQDTSGDRNGEQDIIIHNTMPEYFREYNPFSVYIDDFLDWTFEPYTEDGIAYFYGIDFDRFTRLHSDWKETHGDFGIYSYTNKEENSYNIVWTRNRISYELPNGTLLTVEAERELDLDIVADGKQNDFSTINGFSAMIYRDGDFGDGKAHDTSLPHYDAVIQMGKSVVHISAAGFTKEEFLNVLYKYTGSYVPPTPNSGDRLNVKDSFNILEECPHAYNLQVLFNEDEDPYIFDGFTKRKLTIDEVNSLYGIVFDRLGKLYTDWDEQGKDQLHDYECYNPGIYESGTYNRLYYNTPNGAAICVKAQLGKLPTSKIDTDEVSYVNGLHTVIYRMPSVTHFMYDDFDDKFKDSEKFGATIDFNGLKVNISSAGLTESEFINVLKEYTAKPDSETNTEKPKPNDDQNIIKLHDKAPEFFEAENPFTQPDAPNLSGCKFQSCTLEELNEYYGIEFDRLTRLHKDWKEQHGDLGIYMYGECEIVYARNSLDYHFKNGSFVKIEVMLGGELPVEVFNGVNNMEPITTYSTINGCQAMLSRSGFAGESYDSKIYPNGDQYFGAVIKIDDTLVHFMTAGLTEEQFLNVLDEYTK